MILIIDVFENVDWHLTNFIGVSCMNAIKSEKSGNVSKGNSEDVNYLTLPR